MSSALLMPAMTREEFLDWADAQEERYEFDGMAPVAMTGGLVDHSRISGNILFALRNRLQGTGCRALGEAGLATVGAAVRYPDVLVTCSTIPPRSRLVPGVVAVFEVISPGNPAVDRIIKLREYWAVASIRTYVIVEQQSIGVTVLERRGDISWTATALTGADTLRLTSPELEIPVSEFYLDVDLAA